MPLLSLALFDLLFNKMVDNKCKLTLVGFFLMKPLKKHLDSMNSEPVSMSILAIKFQIFANGVIFIFYTKQGLAKFIRINCYSA